jgi:hypothetical protein
MVHEIVPVKSSERGETLATLQPGDIAYLHLHDGEGRYLQTVEVHGPGTRIAIERAAE